MENRAQGEIEKSCYVRGATKGGPGGEVLQKSSWRKNAFLMKGRINNNLIRHGRNAGESRGVRLETRRGEGEGSRGGTGGGSRWFILNLSSPKEKTKRLMQIISRSEDVHIMCFHFSSNMNLFCSYSVLYTSPES